MINISTHLLERRAARQAKGEEIKGGASADSAEERKDTTGVNPWRLHSIRKSVREEQ